MVLFAVYAVVSWCLTWRYRRQWRGVGVVAASALGLIVLGWLHYELLTYINALFYLSILRVILVPYGLLVTAVGLFLVAQRRTWARGLCVTCGYSLSGISPDPLAICPECGTGPQTAPDSPKHVRAA